MASSPQRPFVPHRTPSRQRPAIGTTSEFRLARPFVPGAEHDGADIIAHAPTPAPAAAASASARTDSDASILSIENFFHRPAQTPIAPQSSEDQFDDGSELPPVEHFLDPLPRVGDFAPAAGTDAAGAGYEGTVAGGPSSEIPASEWAHTDWQQYDWRSVAALAETADTAALNAWASTDWDAAAMSAAKDQQRTAAQAIATALQQIAKKIRDGELAVPMPGSATDPTTIAATLAALLGIRQ